MQLFLKINLPHLVAAAILCSIGYVYCDVITFLPCTESSGYLHIIQMKTEEGGMIIIKESSRETPTPLKAGGLMKWEQISVYNCSGAVDATTHTVQGNSFVTITDTANKGGSFSFLSLHEYKQLDDEILNAAYLWKKDGWRRLCKNKPGLLSIYVQQNPVIDPTHGLGFVHHNIMGVSGDDAAQKIDHLLTFEVNPFLKSTNMK